MAWVQDTKQFWNWVGSRRAKTSPKSLPPRKWGCHGKGFPGQFQEGLKPFQLALAKEFHMDPGIGSADGGADGDGNNIHQLVASGARIASTKPLPIASGCLK